MTIKELRATIRTYKDWELEEMKQIIGNEELTKQHMIIMELKRREQDRSTGKYEDQTLNPKVPIRKRL